MKYKMVNGLCVPETTPDNFQELENERWLGKQRLIKEVVEAQKESQNLYYAMTDGLEN